MNICLAEVENVLCGQTTDMTQQTDTFPNSFAYPPKNVEVQITWKTRDTGGKAALCLEITAVPGVSFPRDYR